VFDTDRLSDYGHLLFSSVKTATLFYRIGFSAPVRKGDVIFKLDSAKQEAAMETARRKMVEVDAGLLAARACIRKARRRIKR
jgi:hypothetical protein